MIRYKYFIEGIVQGVGFRPFTYRLANELDLKGFVLNNSKGVILELEGDVQNIELFDERLLEELPPLAKINNFEKHPITIQKSSSFEIIQSLNNSIKTTLISADIKICNDCLKDIKQKGKYSNYFATNCTNCGPRYSIIQTVPYDRQNTSMSKFIMCESCQKEYSDPMNRRYHAQPISCNDCGPKLFVYKEEQKIQIDNIYKEAARLIKAGNIVAIKGIGGFHIVCDATNDTVIENLRKYKNRPSKPFAIMCKDIDQINSIASISPKEKEIISSKEAPIVILQKKESRLISKYIAPNINKIGCFLPTTALHFLLFEYLDNPIIATSANLGGEPILTTKEQIRKKLPFIQYIIDFNRDIINAVDDSLVQIIDKKISMLRLARGYAPKVIKLPFRIKEKILAVGANAKSTIALAFEDTIIVSPHIGDLDSMVSFEYFTRTIETFQRFYDFIPDIIVHDLHPNYETTKWAKQIAREKDIKLFEVQHHLAHIYSIKAEHNLQNKEYLGFSFDGTGYGEDNTLWGGEVFINDERKYSFKPIKLIGGTKAIKEPRRIALAMLFERFSFNELLQLDLPTIKAFSESELKLLYQSYQKNINCFETSSVGRLFDGIASFADIIQVISYEGESGLLIESFYDETLEDSFAYTIENNIIDIKFIDYILNHPVTKESFSTMLINTLDDIIIDISDKHHLDIYLTGGVFQNKTLLEKILNTLGIKQRNYYINHMIPSNDGGISLGQIYKATLALKEK